MPYLFLISNTSFLFLAFVIITVLKFKKYSFNVQTLLALVMGIIIGLYIYYFQQPVDSSNRLVFSSLEIYRIFSEIYINLIKAMIYPLIIVAILTSLTKINHVKELGKYGSLIIGILLFGVAVSALIAIGVIYFLGTAENIVLPVENLGKITQYQDRIPSSLATLFINFFPSNPFLDLTGSRRSSTIATVIFLLLIGIAYLLVKKQHPEEADFFKKLINSLYVIVMKALTLIIRLTPYGILPLIAKIVATTHITSMLIIANALIAMSLSIFLVFIVHTVLLMLFGFNPFTYYKKALPLLVFAFFSRSSAASIPFGIDTQVNKLGINSSIANLSTTLGSIIGQAGCVGVYVPFIIFMTASAIGVNPWNFSFILFTILIVTVTSFGIGGIGGGAIYGALIALAAFNYPVGILSLLIPIEAIIDMGRTALNVNGLTISGLLTSKMTRSLNIDTYVQNTEREVATTSKY